MTETNKRILLFCLPFALKAGLFRIIIDYLPKKIEAIGIENYYTSILTSFILEIFFIAYLIRLFENREEITLNFKGHLKISCITMLIIGIIYQISCYIYNTYINPNFLTDALTTFMDQYTLKERDPELYNQLLGQINTSSKSRNFFTYLSASIWFLVPGTFIATLTKFFILRNYVKK